jgi:NAD(P)H-dependent FMN reductase
MHFAVLYGSLRRDRQGIRAARFITRQVQDRGHQATLVDAMERPLPLLDRMYKEYPKGQAPEVMEQLAQLYRAVDGFLIVSGEYNHGIQPGLKNLLDHFLEEYFFRPSGIVCYSAGPWGGVRAAMQLRMTLAELGMPSISSLLPIPQVQNQFEEDGTPRDESWVRRAGRFLADVEWWAEAAQRQRAVKAPPY